MSLVGLTRVSLDSLTVLRNFCAHGSLIWNCVFPVPFAVDDAIPIAYNSRRLAAAMSLVELYLNRLDLNIAKFVSERSAILATVPMWQIRLICYPLTHCQKIIPVSCITR